MRSRFLKDLQERGLIYQATNLEALDELFSTQKVTGYQGFDATGDSLHIGSLVGIMMLRRMEKAGHKPIVLLGGATTLIGDPSDKEKERPLLSEEIIQKNLESLKQIFYTYLKDPIIVNNADWLKGMNYISFLREIGRHVSINRMMSFEFVKNRIESNKPLSFLEFNYMILQGYDFYHLYQKQNCILQLGGSDQWGNILNGVELTHKILGKEVYGLTMPLLTTSSGNKMGKTASGQAIWLNKDKTKPYDFWQYFRNVDDVDVEKLFYTFTDLAVSEIQEIMKSHDINLAKKRLADEVTILLHGGFVLPEIHQTVSLLFEKKSGDLSAIPSLNVTEKNLVNALVLGSIYKSRSEAKNSILGGAVRINENKILDPLAEVDWEDDMILSVGKKHHYRIVKAYS